MRYQAKRVPFSVETHGWEVEIHDLGFTLLPQIHHPDDFTDASLQFFAYATDEPPLSHEQLMEKLKERMQAPLAHPPADTPLLEMSCGSFGGWYCEFVGSDGNYWRLWELTDGRTELFVAYSTESKWPADRRRHREVVDTILSTLAGA